MAPLVYTLCALTCVTCFGLLARSYWRTKGRLLFWSAWCFLLLTINNVLVVMDKVIWPVEVDLKLWRLGFAFVGMALLLYSLVWEED